MFFRGDQGGLATGNAGSRTVRPAEVWDTTKRVPPGAYRLGNASRRMREKFFAALAPVSSTSS